MENQNSILKQFLKDHENKSKESREFTHTSMGKPFTKYNISDEENELFLEYYENAIKNGENYHITEKHKDVSPILIDFDFKFDLQYSERQYNENHIIEIIKLYNTEIKNIFNIDDEDDKLTSFVFQRDEPYKSKDIIKDGLHIMYPYIVCEPNVQHYIRKCVLKNIHNVLKDLKFKNDSNKPLDKIYEDVVDKAVIYTNGWLLFQSTKPGLPPYQLTYIFDYDVDELNINEYHFDNKNICSFFSIRNKVNSVTIKHDKKHLIDKVVSTNHNSLTKKKKVIKKKLTSLIIDESFKDIVLNISDDYADDFSLWMNVGLALHNIDDDNDELLEIWKEFSKKSSKYQEGICEKYWKTMNTMEGGVSVGSLHHWSRESDPKRYEEIKRTSIQYLIDKTINAVNNYDIAKVLYEMNKFKFVYTDNKVWYEYKNHRYSNIKDAGIPLKKKISTELCNEYQQLISDNNKIITCDDPNISEDDRESLEKKNKELTSICTKLKTTKFKNDVMTECKELFIQSRFEEKLDSNKYLVGFENGVYDLQNLKFRDGTPDDYITFSTKIDYIPFDDIDQDDPNFQEMLHFLETVFVDEEVRHYFLKVLSSSLQGHNAEEKFRVWTGTGCHAKNSLIMMYNGLFKPVQDIIEGDLLMGDDKTPRTVLELKRGFGKMFKIIPKLDKPFVVNDEHILCLKNNNNNIIEIKVIDYLNSNQEFKDEYKYIYLSSVEFVKRNSIDNPFSYGLDLIIDEELITSNYFIRAEIFKGILESKYINKKEYYYTIELQYLTSKYDDYIYLIKSLGHYAYIYDDYLIIILGLNKLEFTIESIDDDNYYGFELDGNHRYLDNNFITHHNSNGKSKLEELFIQSFGEYCCNLPITLLTGKRAASNAATPEIAQAVGKRFVYFEEPSEGERINAGLMKEMSGGSTMKARGLHKDPIEFKPQFKMHLLCNDIPYIPPNDSGTARRMEIIEFKSKFCDKPDPKNPFEFPIDKEISNKIQLWKEYFMSYLIEKYKDYKKEGVSPPIEVVKFTTEHQKDCDLYADFIDTHIKVMPGRDVCINFLMEEFKMWFGEEFGSQKPMLSKKEFKKYIEKKLKIKIKKDKIKDFILCSDLKELEETGDISDKTNKKPNNMFKTKKNTNKKIVTEEESDIEIDDCFETIEN